MDSFYDAVPDSLTHASHLGTRLHAGLINGSGSVST